MFEEDFSGRGFAVKMANAILDMECEIQRLEMENFHLKDMDRMHREHMEKMSESTMQSIGGIFKIALDPDSFINQAHNAKAIGKF